MTNPYSVLPGKCFWRTAVSESNVLSTSDLYTKRYEILPTDKIASGGSCFAQHVSSRLVKSGYQFLDVEPSPAPLEKKILQQFGYGIYSARYGNIYTTRQLLQLAKEAIGRRQTSTLVWEKGGRYYDPLRPSVEPNGLNTPEQVLFHRQYHLSCIRRMLEEMNLFVFTLGLTEVWVCKETGTAFPTAPGTVAGSFSSDKYQFVNLTHEEIYADLSEFIRLVWDIQGNRNCKFLFTVSPVSLTATATSNHVLVATSYSKSVLRSVAGRLFEEHELVDYYPSYEIIVSPWSRGLFFDSNLRTVSSAGVDAAMRPFFIQHKPLNDQWPQAKQTELLKDSVVEAVSECDDVLCEEALLEGFFNG